MCKAQQDNILQYIAASCAHKRCRISEEIHEIPLT